MRTQKTCRIFLYQSLILLTVACFLQRLQAEDANTSTLEVSVNNVIRGFSEPDRIKTSAGILVFFQERMHLSARFWMDKNRLSFDDEKKYYGQPFIDLLAQSKDALAIPYLYQDILLKVHHELKLHADRPCLALLYNYGPSVTDPILNCIAKSDYKHFDRQTAVIELLKGIYGSEDEDIALIHQIIERHLRKHTHYGEPERIRITVFADLLKKSREK